MKFERLKSQIARYETVKNPGADQILSLVQELMNDVQREARQRISELPLISKPGNEEMFLVTLKTVAAETVKMMKKINPGEMVGFEDYAAGVCNKEEAVQKVADTIEQWEKAEEECREVRKQIAEAEKKLQEKKAELQELETQKAKLQEEINDSCLTEEACQSEITRLTEELKTVPTSEKFVELQKEMKGIKEHYRVINGIVTDFLEDHSAETRKTMGFDLAEEQCKDYLQTIADRIGKLETYYGAMLKQVEEQRSLKESEYAGK